MNDYLVILSDIVLLYIIIAVLYAILFTGNFINEYKVALVKYKLATKQGVFKYSLIIFVLTVILFPLVIHKKLKYAEKWNLGEQIVKAFILKYDPDADSIDEDDENECKK